jgi:hypothetical protein
VKAAELSLNPLVMPPANSRPPLTLSEFAPPDSVAEHDVPPAVSVQVELAAFWAMLAVIWFPVYDP